VINLEGKHDKLSKQYASLKEAAKSDKNSLQKMAKLNE